MNKKQEFIDEFWDICIFKYEKLRTSEQMEEIKQKWINKLEEVIEEESLWNYTVLHNGIILEVKKAVEILNKIKEIKP